MEEEELKRKLDLRNKFYSWHLIPVLLSLIKSIIKLDLHHCLTEPQDSILNWCLRCIREKQLTLCNRFYRDAMTLSGHLAMGRCVHSRERADHMNWSWESNRRNFSSNIELHKLQHPSRDLLLQCSIEFLSHLKVLDEYTFKIDLIRDNRTGIIYKFCR